MNSQPKINLAPVPANLKSNCERPRALRDIGESDVADDALLVLDGRRPVVELTEELDCTIFDQFA